MFFGFVVGVYCLIIVLFFEIKNFVKFYFICLELSKFGVWFFSLIYIGWVCGLFIFVFLKSENEMLKLIL